MAQIENFKDLVIRWNGHQKYRSNKVIEDEIVEVIVQKLEMTLFTSKNEVYGQESEQFGCDLEYYLWKTTVANDILRGEIAQQINKWIPELNIIGYDLTLDVYSGTVRDILEINFTILGYNVEFIWS